MQYIPTYPTLRYERNEENKLVDRYIWMERGEFYLEGVEHELMTTRVDTANGFDKVIIRLEQELKQASNYVPNMELVISIFEAYLTLPIDIEEVVGGPIGIEVLDRLIHRLEPIESDIIGINKISNIPISGSGDALNFMTIINNVMVQVHKRLHHLRQEGYYLGCITSDSLDIILVRPY